MVLPRPWSMLIRAAVIQPGKAMQTKEIALALDHIRRSARGAHGVEIGQT